MHGYAVTASAMMRRAKTNGMHGIVTLPHTHPMTDMMDLARHPADYAAELTYEVQVLFLGLGHNCSISILDCPAVQRFSAHTDQMD